LEYFQKVLGATAKDTREDASPVVSKSNGSISIKILAKPGAKQNSVTGNAFVCMGMCAFL
jgi:hypothetical protein